MSNFELRFYKRQLNDRINLITKLNEALKNLDETSTPYKIILTKAFGNIKKARENQKRIAAIRLKLIDARKELAKVGLCLVNISTKRVIGENKDDKESI